MHMLCKCFSFVLKMLYDTKYIKDLLPKLPRDLGIQVLYFKSLSSSCGSELRLSPFLVTEQQGFFKEVLWACKIRFCGLQAPSQCSGTQGERGSNWQDDRKEEIIPICAVSFPCSKYMCMFLSLSSLST